MAETTVQRPVVPKSDTCSARTTPYANGSVRPSYSAGMQSAPPSSSVADLGNVFDRLSVQPTPYHSHHRPSNMPHSGYGSVPMDPVVHPAYYGQIMYGHPFAAPQGHSSAIYTPGGQHLAQHFVQGHDNSPASQDWTPSQHTIDMPFLITPGRDSISSAEGEDPGTPSYANYPAFPIPGGVSVMNRSPNGNYTTGTPSPLQAMAYGMPIQKAPSREVIPHRLQLLVRKEPAIPPAVPAPSSPPKPLDRALENVRGETNVYIRGLLPETSDEMLETWGKRFGDIKSSKSIIDHTTRLCKGFGFIRFHNYTDAEDCIRGFHHLGYEVSFARESFYSKLKAVADDGNTNLYVSNLPKAMNEHELGLMFEPHNVLSARILRDKNGVGRGVGFARFENRQACEEVIKAFNNKTIQAHGEDYTVQIRYADTQEQKHLKQTTAAARQFRSAEYEFATQAHKNGWLGNSSRYNSAESESGTPNEFDTFLGTKPGLPIQQQRWAQPAWRQNAGRWPLGTISNNHHNINRRRGTSFGFGKSHVAKAHTAPERTPEDHKPAASASPKDTAEGTDDKQ